MLLLLGCLNTATLQLADPVDPGEVRFMSEAGMAVQLPVSEVPPDDAPFLVAGAPATWVNGDFAIRTGLSPRMDAGLRLSIWSGGLGAGVKVAFIESDAFDLALGPQVMTYNRLITAPRFAGWSAELPLLIGVQPADFVRFDGGFAVQHVRNRRAETRVNVRRAHAMVLFAAEEVAWVGPSWNRTWQAGADTRIDQFGVMVVYAF